MNGLIHFVLSTMMAAQVGATANTGPAACEAEPSHLVHHVGAPGYTFKSGGCDFVANKDKLVVVK